MKILKGNIFTTKCQTIVNTVNTSGIMGAGIALEYKLRYPIMYQKYRLLCKNKELTMGKLWLYKYSDERYILNFPTKINWKYPSKVKYLDIGLSKFVETYIQQGIKSIAFPLLGASKGGISQSKSLERMKKYLDKCEIPVEIYIYDPNSLDDLYMLFKEKIESTSISDILKDTKIRKDIVIKILDTIKIDKIKSISQLASIKGIGLKSMEKIFLYVMNPSYKSTDEQLNLLL